MQTTIQKWGNSQGIRIPKAYLEAVGLAENDTVELQRIGDNILIKKVQIRKKRTLSKLFEGYDPKEHPQEYAWDEPVGKEVW